MSNFGFIDTPAEAAIVVWFLVLFAVLGFAYVMGWMSDDEEPRVRLTTPGGGGWIELPEGPQADLLRSKGYEDIAPIQFGYEDAE